jgi:hypothetical protein
VRVQAQTRFCPDCYSDTYTLGGGDFVHDDGCPRIASTGKPITWPDPRPGTCGDDGPWGTRCTEDPGHRYAHYDASDDSSWTDDVMREWAEDHPEAKLPADSLYRPQSHSDSTEREDGA